MRDRLLVGFLGSLIVILGAVVLGLAIARWVR